MYVIVPVIKSTWPLLAFVGSCAPMSRSFLYPINNQIISSFHLFLLITLMYFLCWAGGTGSFCFCDNPCMSLLFHSIIFFDCPCGSFVLNKPCWLFSVF